MARSPLPLEFPGEFFVLEWDREIETFTIRLDDLDESSFNVGDDPRAVVHLLHLRFREHDRLELEDVVDRAREFGACAFNPSTHRVVQLLPRKPKPAHLDFGVEHHETSWTPSLY